MLRKALDRLANYLERAAARSAAQTRRMGANGLAPCSDPEHKPETLGVLPWPNGQGIRHTAVCTNEGCTWTYTYDAIRVK